MDCSRKRCLILFFILVIFILLPLVIYKNNASEVNEEDYKCKNKNVEVQKVYSGDSYKKSVTPICWSRDKSGQYYISSYVRIIRDLDGIEEVLESKVIVIPVERIRYDGKMLYDIRKCYE